jgi:hypothetical protein
VHSAHGAVIPYSEVFQDLRPLTAVIPMVDYDIVMISSSPWQLAVLSVSSISNIDLFAIRFLLITVPEYPECCFEKGG